MENEKNDKEKKIHELERWERRIKRCMNIEQWQKHNEFEKEKTHSLWKGRKEFLKHYCIFLFPLLILISKKTACLYLLNWLFKFRLDSTLLSTFHINFKQHTVGVYGNLPCSTNPLVFPFSYPFLSFFSSPFLLPCRLYFFGHHSSFFISVIVLHSHVCMHKYVCIHVILHLCEYFYVCLCVCVCAPIPPQKPLCFSSVALSAVAKTGPSPCCLSAANGGAGVGLPGHVSGWWPCQSIRKMHDKTHFACRRTGYESNQSHVEKLYEIKGFIINLVENC